MPRKDGARPVHFARGRGYVDPDRPRFAWIRFVCDPDLRSGLIDRSEDDDVSLSEVVRRACREYLSTH